MKTKIIVTGAGGGGSNNLISTIHERNAYAIIGTNIDRYKATKSNADKTYVLPPARDQKTYLEKLRKLIDLEKPDLIIPNNDTEVAVLSENRKNVNTTVFLPDDDTIKLCQDKLDFNVYAEKNDISIAETYHVTSLVDIEGIFDRFEDRPLWVRPKHGSGSKGATKVATPEQARFWIDYWNTMRGIPVEDFMISEYLPGTDYAVQSTWKEGELRLMKACSRLSYYGGENRPSGVSSTPAVAQTVDDEEVYSFCTDVVEKVSQKKANGNYCIDLKCREDGSICITEINIGRFFMITPIFNLSGKHSMADVFIKLALNREEDLTLESPFDYEEKYMIRELDTQYTIVTKEELESASTTL